MKQIAPHFTRLGRRQQRRLAAALDGKIEHTREKRRAAHLTPKALDGSRKGYIRACNGRLDTGRADVRLRKF